MGFDFIWVAMMLAASVDRETIWIWEAELRTLKTGTSMFRSSFVFNEFTSEHLPALNRRH